MEDWRGKTLSKVKIQSLLARGGMAQVYLGTPAYMSPEQIIGSLVDA